MDTTFDSQNNFVSKMGITIGSSNVEKILQKQYDAVNMFYTNQAKIIETTLYTLHQNIRMINENVNGFVDLFSSAHQWWIPTKNLQS